MSLEAADFLVEGALAIVAGDGRVLRDAVVAALDGRVVFVGPSADLTDRVARRPGAMRIDASGCSIFPAAAPLTVGAPLDALIAKGEPGAARTPAPDTVRMEIAGGKIVRWAQDLQL